MQVKFISPTDCHTEYEICIPHLTHPLVEWWPAASTAPKNHSLFTDTRSF